MNAADQRGTTPLMAACGAGSFEIYEALIKAGADAKALKAGAQVSADARYDGVTALALSIMSKSRRCITSLLRPDMKLEPREDLHDNTLISAAELLRLASVYLHPFNIAAWLQKGVSPLVLKGEISALMVSLQVCDAEGPTAEMKFQLSQMRALLDFHAVFLEDPPVPLQHAVMQLAAQEPGLVREDSKNTKDGQSTPFYDIIEAINHPARALRFTIQGKDAVRALAYAKDGKRLARGEGNNVVVCCAESGFEQCQLKGHTR